MEVETKTTRRRIQMKIRFQNLDWIIFWTIFLGLFSFIDLWTPTYSGKSEKFSEISPSKSISNKYRDNSKLSLSDVTFGVDASEYESVLQCHEDIDIIWRSQLGAEIYSTPLILDLFGDGDKEIVVTTAKHYVEVLDRNGKKVEGWPFSFPESSFLTDPIAYDVDRDGLNEIMVTTEAGEMVFLRQNGIPISGYTLKVPPIKVRRDWYEAKDGGDRPVSMLLSQKYSSSASSSSPQSRNLLTTEPTPPNTQNASLDSSNSEQDVFKGMGGWLPAEGIESLQLFLPTNTPPSYVSQILKKEDPLYSVQYEEYLRTQTPTGSLDILVDPHVLSTPVIADIDGDGNEDLIVSVSYYFDKKYYSDPENRKKIDLSIDISKYAATGIVVFDLVKRNIKWSLDLDLTTDDAKYPAYVQSSPTVIDLEGDGKLEIIVGTGVGSIYGLDHQGKFLRGAFPINMDSILVSVVVEDLNDDGDIELIAVDSNSNVVCFSSKGEELWTSRIHGYSEQEPTIGDINSDGILDIVLSTNEGAVWAFQGVDGKLLSNFPVKLGGKAQSRPLLVPLDSPLSRVLHIVQQANDGFIYIINGDSGCYDKLNLGEVSYSMILADDLNGNSQTELIVTTVTGHVYLLRTDALFNSFYAWTSFDKGRNGYSVNQKQGVRLTSKTKHISGRYFTVEFEIIDKRTKDKTSFYNVQISFGKQKLLSKIYGHPGLYSEMLPTPTNKTMATLEIEMTNEHHQAFFDSHSIQFNQQFYRILKWFLVGPFLVLVIVLIFYKEILATAPLPMQI